MRKREWSEESVRYIQQTDKEHFLKMYPNVNMQDKYILWLQLNFMWSYQENEIEPEIHIVLKNGNELETPKLSLRHSYPNKQYYTMCMKSGRKKSEAGILLWFDSFEEISQINEINYIWRIKIGQNKEYCAFYSYKVSFEKDARKKNYSVSSFDTDMVTIGESMEKETVFTNKLDEYMNAYIVDTRANELKTAIIKGSVSNEDLLQVNSIAKDKQNTDYHIECFVAIETLEAKECSTI